ncbi:hypothetical protein COB11_01225 [Candidatus Aerophobetes bacterium]|uniref:Uncharacterized protein n=1 Tax=Aerophobetes bacterium TaxID=2030807 RepID=A0A2A4YM13_UNCAE|nr:MAG: hypothetical protein COB11_01225 [Candidatus Aerophobetes bacterium]
MIRNITAQSFKTQLCTNFGFDEGHVSLYVSRRIPSGSSSFFETREKWVSLNNEDLIVSSQTTRTCCFSRRAPEREYQVTIQIFLKCTSQDLSSGSPCLSCKRIQEITSALPKQA